MTETAAQNGSALHRDDVTGDPVPVADETAPATLPAAPGAEAVLPELPPRPPMNRAAR